MLLPIHGGDGGGSNSPRNAVSTCCWSPPNSFRFWPSVILAELVQPCRVVAYDLLAYLLGQMAHALFDNLQRVGKYPVPVRIIRAPHDGIGPDPLDLVHGDVFFLEGGGGMGLG